jgi:hypothetical protein
MSTTATDMEQPRASDVPELMEEVEDILEVKQQKETKSHKPTRTETDNYCMRILIKTVKILTPTNLDG